MGIATFPYKADTPLVIYPDTVLSGAVSFELFKPIGGRDSQRFQLVRRSEHFKFPRHQALNIARETAGESPFIDLFGFPALKGFNHALILACHVSIWPG
jgi:hypothetical protein